MPHIILLGDSIFDNGAFTGGEPDVVTHLRQVVPARWHATLRAVDGATTASIHTQLQEIPADATHLVVSVGGNDVLGHIDLLSTPVRSTAEALTLFRKRRDEFAARYHAAIQRVLERGLPVTLCTIYDGNLPEPQSPLAPVVLSIFNDVILRTAFERHCGAIELRLVCSDPADYANPIEPSGRGGAKIARAIAHATGALPGPASAVFASL